MTQLLVSVRNRAEALVARDCGVDLIDIKEPKAGPLGAASRDVIDDVCRAVADDVPVSAACGELLDKRDFAIAHLPADLTFAKLGLQGLRDTGWPSILNSAWNQLPESVAPVAVCYADYEFCHAPCPLDVIRHGVAQGCAAVLFDTFDKTRGSLTDIVAGEVLADWCQAVRGQSLKLVLAGSLTLSTLDTVVERFQPDIVAVRGAACSSKRTGEISSGRTRELVRVLRGVAA